MTQQPQDSQRTFEMSIEIDAPPDVVWRAIAEGDELARWFPPAAKVEPGVGGAVWLSWGEGMEGSAPITIWDPPRRLRTTQKMERPVSPGEAQPEPVEISVEYHIEAKAGGGTVVRLVHSGFGRGSGWDNDYDSISNGWKYELRSLKHYLERHRGQDRRTVYERSTPRMSREAAWSLVTGPGGLCAEGSIAGLNPGQPYRVRTAAGDVLSGTVLVNNPPKSFVGTVADLDDALLRIEVEPGDEMVQPLAWMSIWGPKRDRAAAFAASWRSMLDTLFGSEKLPFYAEEREAATKGQGQAN